jgi:membrane protease subunit HflK
MVDAKGNSNLLYLPLDKLMQAAGAQVATPVSSAEQAPRSGTAPAATGDVPPQLEKVPAMERSGDYRSRSSLDSRDRGDR